MSNEATRPTPAQRLHDLSGWRRYGVAFLIGGLATLAMAPVNFFPALAISVPAFIWLASGARSAGKSFLCGWAFGCGYFIVGLYWVSAALFVDIAAWGWVLPLSLIVGPAVFALYYGFISLAAHRFRHNATAHALIIVAAWAAIEWLRGHLLTGFPWNLPGYAWHYAPPVMQGAALVGVYGLSLLTLFWAAFPAYRHHRGIAVLSLVSFAVVIGFGASRLYLHPTLQNGTHTVRIVQPNLPQNQKWDQEQQWENLETHARLSLPKKPATFVIWPETAVVTDLVMFPEIARFISYNIPQGSLGVLGSLRVTPNAQGGPDDYHNSVSVLDGKGKVTDYFDKFHLVPFGEYIPFRQYLNLTPIALAISNIGDFVAGDGNKTIRPQGLPAFSPLICYEIIFPRAVVKQEDRPEWLVNVTNDGWYGNSSGPYQHLETARMRAIEEGLPVARAANTGVSAVFDPLGRTIAKLGLGEQGTLDSILPAPLPATVYARFGDILFLMLLGCLFILGFCNAKKS